MIYLEQNSHRTRLNLFLRKFLHTIIDDSREAWLIFYMNNKDIDVKTVYDIAKKHFLFSSERIDGVLADTKIKSLLENNRRRINVELFSKAYGFPKSQFNALKWVMMTSKLEGNSKLVEITIASYYNSDKGFAFPSQELIKFNTGLSARTVNNAVLKMKESGRWLVKQSFSEGRPRTTNCYFILPPLGYGGIGEIYKENPDLKKFSSLLEANLETVIKAVNNRAKNENGKAILAMESLADINLSKEGHVYRNFPKLFKTNSKEDLKIFSKILNKAKA